ncbi:MAG: hypothetical protein AB1Z98_33925, partial [Nannocystaceae bacterium]
MPGTRSTLDGRLHIIRYGHRPVLGPMYPENLDYGSQTRADLPVWPDAGQADIRPFMLMDNDSAYTPAELEDIGVHYQYSGGSDLCSRGDESRPYPCQAQMSEVPGHDTSWRSGICYDVSIVSLFSEDKEEIRSNELTVFLENGGIVPVPSDGLDRNVWIYPTAGVQAHGAGVVDGSTVLPPFEDFAPAALDEYGDRVDDGVATLQAGGFEFEVAQTLMWLKQWRTAYEMADDECSSFLASAHPTPQPSHLGGAPRWCWYFDRMSRSGPVVVNGENDSLVPPTHFRPIEVSTTGDGHVILGQDARAGGIGAFYAYSDDPCDASGWTEIQPISEAYWDPDMHGTYGFAEYRMIKPSGVLVDRAEPLGGAYPWIDRKGANLFLGTDVHPFGWLECSAPSSAGQNCAGVELQDVNEKNAKAPKVVGLWTRGKIVHIDGVLNGVDYTARPVDGALDKAPFYLSLFRNEDWVKVRPGNNIDFFSLENLYGHVETLTPLLPADVVWTVTTGGRGEGNSVIGEVPFDDYLMWGSMIVAPMNDRLQGLDSAYEHPAGVLNQGGPDTWRRRNGMSLHAANPGASQNEEYTGTDLFLQNNAPLTSSLPILELRGGAFIPPASTGVIGKAVYLDGFNDRIEVSNVDPVDRFYVGLWVETHSAWGTLLTFSNGATLNVGSGSVEGVNIQLMLADGTLSTATGMPCRFGNTAHGWSSDLLELGRWTHVGLTLDSSGGGSETRVRLYVDGTPVDGVATLPIESAGFVDGTFEVGTKAPLCHNASALPPIAAWVDELKLFELRSGDFDSGYLDELSCNRALGSLDGFGSCEQIPFRQLEVLDCNGVGSGLEFPKATYSATNCGTTVHRNRRRPGLDCARESLLGIEPIVPTDPRSADDTNPFCLSCHTSGGPKSDDPSEPYQRFDLSVTALTAGTGPATEDLRRQPMHWTQPWDEAVWSGHSNVRLIDPGRIERCDGADNDGDGVVDNGCGVCGGDDELGRISMWGGKVDQYRDHDGYWSPRGTTSGLTTNPAVIEGRCEQQFDELGDFSTAVVVTPRATDPKPFITATDVLYPARGSVEYICCGDRFEPEPEPEPVPVTVEVLQLGAPGSISMTMTCEGSSLSHLGSTYFENTICLPGDLTLTCSGDGMVGLSKTIDGFITGPFGSCSGSMCTGVVDLDTESSVDVSCSYVDSDPGDGEQL